jgi:anti-anti-sigma factor
MAFVVRLHGEFDLSDCDRLRDAFSIPTTAKLVVVDFQKASYIDSSVLLCLFELRQKTADRGAELALVGVTSTVRRIFEICRFDELFDIQESLSALMRARSFDGADVRMLTLVSRPAPADRATDGVP